MPPSTGLQAVRARADYYPPASLNIPVIGLVLAFAILLVVCAGICCCSYRKAAKRNKHYQQRRERADGDLLDSTCLHSPLMNDGLDAPAVKDAKWSESREPPAYSTLNHATLGSPQISYLGEERLLPPSPITPRALSPPPPTYRAAR
jgi:hypothetical protein